MVVSAIHELFENVHHDAEIASESLRRGRHHSFSSLG